jgi:hypothetical protein
MDVVSLNAVLYAIALSRREDGRASQFGEPEECWKVHHGLIHTITGNGKFDANGVAQYYKDYLERVRVGPRNNKRALPQDIIRLKVDEARRLAESPLFGLDSLSVNTYDSEERVKRAYQNGVHGLSFRGVRLPRFDMYIGQNRTYERWLDYAFKHHAELARALNIRDLYAEWKADCLPF